METDEFLLRTESKSDLNQESYFHSDLEEESSSNLVGDLSDWSVVAPPKKVKFTRHSNMNPCVSMLRIVMYVLWCGRSYIIPVLSFFLGMIVMFSVFNSRVEYFCRHIRVVEDDTSENIVDSHPNSPIATEGNEVMERYLGHPGINFDFFNDSQLSEPSSRSQEYGCFGKSTSESCSGHGTCDHKDFCRCDPNFDGKECEFCELEFYGEKCEESRVHFHPSLGNKREFLNLRTSIVDMVTKTSESTNLCRKIYYEKEDNIIFVILLDNVAKYHLEYGDFLVDLYEREKRKILDSSTTNEYLKKKPLRLILVLMRKEQKFKKFPDEKCLCFGDCVSVDNIKQLLNRVTFSKEGDTPNLEVNIEKDESEDEKSTSDQTIVECFEDSTDYGVIMDVFRVNYDKETFDFTDCYENENTFHEIRDLWN